VESYTIERFDAVGDPNSHNVPYPLKALGFLERAYVNIPFYVKGEG